MKELFLSDRFAASAGAAVNLHFEQVSIIEEVRQRLSNGAYSYFADGCPCGSPYMDVLVAGIDRYGLPLKTVLCQACGTLRTNPYLVPQDLEHFYTHFYQTMYRRAVDPGVYFEQQGQYGSRVLSFAAEFLSPGDFVFEVGCGAGGALRVFQEAGYQVGGCDYSRELIEFGLARGLRSLFVGDPVNILRDLKIRPKVIYLHHVFEHISQPVEWLQALAPYIASGGYLVIVVPDITRIDSHPFPAGDARLFFHIAHRYNFSISGMERVGRRAGFTVERCEQRSARLAPEFWTALRPGNRERALKEIAPTAGQEMLSYLRRTERRYALGLTRGQIENRRALWLGRGTRAVQRAREAIGKALGVH